MNTSLLWLLLLLSCASLAGLAISGWLVSRAQKYRQKRDARLAMVITPHVRVQRLEVSAFTAPPRPRDQSVVGFAARVFGFDPTSPERYPLPWWMVVLLTLLAAKVLEWLVADFVGRLGWMVIPVTWIGLSRNFFGWFDQRRRSALLAQFPDALAMIVRSVRVGIPVPEAIRTIARELGHPTGPEFARLVNDISVGVSMEDAMLEMARRTGLSEYRFFATAITLQNQTGGTLSETLENLADVIRKRAALKAKGQAMTSEAKTTAGILAVLPFLVAIMLWAINPSYIGLLFSHPTGRNILAASIASLLVGLFLIRTIINRSLPQ